MQCYSQKATAQSVFVNQVEVSDIVIGSKFPNLNLPGKKHSTKALSPKYNEIWREKFSNIGNMKRDHRLGWQLYYAKLTKTLRSGQY